MAKLCYKKGGTVKKYDLKDSANKPRLAVKSGGTTRYLSLARGSKSGEVEIKVGGYTYYVQTKPYEYFGVYSPLDVEKLVSPIRGYAGATRGGYSKLAAWPIYDSEANIVAVIMSGLMLCRSGKHSDTESSTIADLLNVFPDSRVNAEVMSTFHEGYFNDNKKEVLYKVRATVFDCGSNADNDRAATIVYRDMDAQMPTTTLKIRDALLNKITTYAENNPIGNCADNSITDSTWETKYNGTAVVTPPSGNTGYLRAYSMDTSATQAGLKLLSHGYMNDYNWGTIRASYIEFPKNGLMGVTPEEVINEWYNAVGKRFVFISSTSGGMKAETIMPIPPNLNTYNTLVQAMQNNSCNQVGDVYGGYYGRSLYQNICHYIFNGHNYYTTTTSLGYTTIQVDANRPMKLASKIGNCSNSKNVTFPAPSFTAPTSGTTNRVDKYSKKTYLDKIAVDTQKYVYVHMHEQPLYMRYYYQGKNASTGKSNYQAQGPYTYGSVSYKVCKYSYSASDGYTLIATYTPPAGSTVEVAEWTPYDAQYWRGLTLPLAGTNIGVGNRDKGGAQLWALCREDGYPVYIFGMLAADMDGEANCARWDIRKDYNFVNIDRNDAYQYLQNNAYIRIASGTIAHGSSGGYYQPTPHAVYRYLTNDSAASADKGNNWGHFGYNTLNLLHTSTNNNSIDKSYLAEARSGYDYYSIRIGSNAWVNANLSMRGENDSGVQVASWAKRCFYIEVGWDPSTNYKYRLTPLEVLDAFKYLNEKAGTWDSFAHQCYGRNYSSESGTAATW